MNRIVAAAVSGAALLGLYLFEDQIADALAIDYSLSPEAREWIGANDGEACLASNRFGDRQAALEFVHSLYKAGAARVVVPDDAIIDDGVEVYSDALVVILPPEPAERQHVRAICDREVRREGFDPAEFGDADQIYLWWD